MKQPARKSQSSARNREKFHSNPSAESSSALLRLQVCFFLSGAAGLIDQVVWTKALGLLFGFSAYAVATVLAVFMGGLALGSALFSRWRPGKFTGVALYAWLEFGIAATALLSLPGVGFVRQLYFAAYPHADGSFAALIVLRFVGAAVVLAIPTILMGGTFPALLAGIARESSELGIRAGRFYAVNTAGAVAGTISAGFFLIPWVGLRMTLAIAAVMNLLAGILARSVAQRAAATVSDVAGETIGEQTKSSKLYFVCFALVGATAMAYELGWTRLLATPLGSSTYAFSVMLATFLLGVAAGSALFEKWYRKRRAVSADGFARTQLAIAAAALFSLWMYREIPEVLLFFLRTFGGTFSVLLAAQAVTCSLALLPTTILFGFNFPLVLALVSGDRKGELSGGVGRAIAANTGGAIAGAIAGGFFLLTWIGSFQLVALAAFVNILLAGVILIGADIRNWKPLAIAGILLVAIPWTAVSPTFFRTTAAAYGVVLYGDFHNPALTAREMADTEDIAFFKDGINATIAVTRSENYVALKTNGKVDASNLDSGTQLLLGDLGAVFHPHPRKVLIIGFGGGMTASAVSRFPDVERIDCVEIEPAVLQAAPYLQRLNRGVLGDPRLHLHFDDARNFLQTSHERYDLIISEPSNPWIAGIASLYTEEFFAVVRAHLAPGGNFVQWIQAYGLKVDDFAMILSGIERQFPDLSLWHSSGRDFLVLARTSAEPISFDRSRAMWSNDLLRQDFQALHLTGPESWPAYFRLHRAAIHSLTKSAAQNTDDRTLLEYSAPQNLLMDSLTGELETAISGFEKSPLPDDIGLEDSRLAAVTGAQSALENHDFERADKLLRTMPDTKEREVQVLRGQIRIAKRDYLGAIDVLKAETVNNQYNAQYWLALADRGSGYGTDAESTIDRVLAQEPANILALEAKVQFASDRRDWPKAIDAQRRLADIEQASAAGQCQLGDLELRSGNPKNAEPPLLRGLQLDPYAFLCHRDLGELYRATGRLQEATHELEWVVRYFPESDPKTYVSLALAYQTLGKHRFEAREALEKGKRLFPNDPLLQKFSLKSN
jgi:spermidine synthase